MEMETAPNNLAGKLTMVGLATPLNRCAAAGAATLIFLYATRPSIYFRENGEIRPFKLSSPDPDATYNHFFLAPLVAGWAAGTLL
jgi:hypothetical protein